MDEAVILFLLRLGAAALILTFIGAVLVMLWLDFRTVSSEVESLRTPRGKLKVLTSENETPPVDTEFPVLPLTSLGRATTNTITLPDHFVSTEHALIAYRSGNWWLEDRGSSNGTLLNGTPIDEPVVLDDGDLIGVGGILLQIELEQEE